MSNLFQLDIPKPCNVAWQGMTPTEKGRFCSSCEKEVTDFTRHSIDEIHDAFAKAEGKLCGRFLNDQLGNARVTPIAHRRKVNFLKRFLLAAIVAFGTSLFVIPNEALAQQLDQAHVATTNARGETDVSVLHGCVMDIDTEEAVPFAKVELWRKGKFIARTVADSCGNYALEVPEKWQSRIDKLSLWAVAYPFEEKETTGLALDGKPINCYFEDLDDRWVSWGEEMTILPEDYYEKLKDEPQW